MIRVATQDDTATLASVYAACFDVPWSHQTLADFIEKADVYVAGEVARGFIIVQRVLDEAEIITLAVLPNARRHGVARALLLHASQSAAQAGCVKVFLEVAHDNLGARQLYQGFGFDQIGTRKAYYARTDGHRVDALVLAASLPIAASLCQPNT